MFHINYYLELIFNLNSIEMIKKFLLALGTAVLLGSCNSEPPVGWEDPKNPYSNTNVNTSPAKNTDDSTNVVEESGDLFTLKASKINSINANQIFKYSSDILPNSYVEFVFSENGGLINIEAILNENDNKWANTYTVENTLSSEWTINGMIYKGSIIDNYKKSYSLTLKLNGNDLYYIQIGDRTYTKTPLKVKTSTKDKSNLQYMDNHQVVVRAGENLKYIVDKYNKENGITYTVEEIRIKNKLNRQGVVVPGQIIYFN